MKTIKISPQDTLFDHYRPQIEDIMLKRYKEDLNYQANIDDSVLAAVKEVIITVDDADKVLSASFTLYPKYDRPQRVKTFAVNKDNSLINIAPVIISHLKALLGNEPTFFEVTEDLFKTLTSSFIAKRLNVPLFIFPAASAAIILPKRRVLILDDGVFYEKSVPNAKTFAKKILVANVPVISGQQGYTSFKEASNNSSFQGKLISAGPDGNIREYVFDPKLWRTSIYHLADAFLKFAKTRYDKELENESIQPDDLPEDLLNNIPVKEKLLQYAKTPLTFAHFSDIEGRFGFNPKFAFENPFGIYGYLLENKLYLP